MVRVVVLAALIGALIGVVFFGVEAVAVQRSLHDEGVVTYDGSYTPLEGVEMADAYQTTLDLEFDSDGNWRSHLSLPWWGYPLTGAATTTVIGGVCALAGFRVTRRAHID